MDIEDQTLEEKCECLMNIVVETRKQYAKLCVDYEQKISLVENKMLKYQLKTFGNHRFKPKTHVPHVDMEEMTKDSEDFKEEIISRQKKIESLRQNVTGIQSVVLQLKNDVIGHKLRKKITTETLLAEAKNKLNK